MTGLTWARLPDSKPDGFVVHHTFDIEILSIDRRTYRRELYRRPGPRQGRAYGRAMHRAMKKARHDVAWAAARTYHRRFGDK